MGYKKKSQASLLDLIEGQPGKSKPKLPPPPPKAHPAQTRSASIQSRLPPPPPQTSPPSRHEPADPKQKKDKGKRPIEDKSRSTQEGDDTRRPSKQLKTSSRGQDKHADAQPEVHAWLPAPMLHGGPLRDDFSLRDFREGEGAYVADALERCLLLPADMAELGTMRSREVFLSLKRYLGIAVQAIYRLEEAAHDQGKAMDAEREKRLEATQTLKHSEADLAKAREELKAMTRARDNAVSGLAGYQKQAEDQTRLLGEAEEQLKIAKDLIADLKKRMADAEEAKKVAEWAKEEAVRAKCYCSQTWGEALKQAGVEASSDLWKEESVYYPPAIRKATPDGSKAEEAAEEIAATSGEGASVAGPTDKPVQGSEPPGVVEPSEGPHEEAPQQVAKPSSNAQASNSGEVTIPTVPLQAIPLGQSSEDPEAAVGN
ncbi:uncharacterized protein LOC136068208 [Quercus suber]|uniref:uncharacterized protein LOC136068208 n=1 Tax=Quercus suber TaxID=58331 RepID=UPI0032DF79D9